MLTENKIKSLAPGQKLSDPSPKGHPTLYAKARKTGGVYFYIRYRLNKRDKVKKIGDHVKSSVTGEGITLKEAREIFKNFPVEGPSRTIISDDNGSKDSFGNLLNEYVSHLKSNGKTSADAVEKTLNRHVLNPHAEIVNLRAFQIESYHIQEILSHMVKSGLTRQVNKLRSYLHAAFSYSASFDNDPRNFTGKSRKYNINNNPVSLIPVIGEFENAKERNLTNAELKLYWESLPTLSPVMEMCLKVQLLLAGQRFTLLTKLEWKDYDEEYQTITLTDTKGRNSRKQPHILPLSNQVLAFFKQLKAWNHDYKWPFTIKGVRQLPVQDGSAAVSKISTQLSSKYDIEPFGLGDMRRTAETMLSKLRVDKETRAHLLSHGRSVGVQSIHYDKYDYFDEKMEALKLWEQHLDKIFSPD